MSPWLRRAALALVAIQSAHPIAHAARTGDGAIDRPALLHDSRSRIYRSPSGAVPAGTVVTLRLRARAGDLASAHVVLTTATTHRSVVTAMIRAWTFSDGGQQFELWEAAVPLSEPAVTTYRFVVRDGDDVAFYEDDPAREGQDRDRGTGRAYDVSPDYPWHVTAYEPTFTTPEWLRRAVIYQVFPDRFFNGDPSNDPTAKDPAVYGLPIVKRAWTDLPEGHCRYYTGTCCDENPRGRDFYGGDLEGLRQKLGYLRDLGVTVVYLNPIFESPTNHGYDTSDYERIARRFGDAGLFKRVASEARELGLRLLLDGVFNHVASDSVYFDRYERFRQVGAWESRQSPYSSWFTFDPWPDGYKRWAGVDSMPVLTEAPGVKEFIFGAHGIAQRWLREGASGWRLDVMQDKSHAFWEDFRRAVKARDPDAAIVGEWWHDASDWFNGREIDSVMNYRFRRAVIGFVNGDTVDANGRIAALTPSQFDAALTTIEEDYPPNAVPALMNLLDTHDTERILWTFTPGIDQPAAKSAPANLDTGIRRLKLASLLQFTLPGAPSIYYGSEAGLTGDTDPDDRRPFPWGHERRDLQQWFTTLAHLRTSRSFFATGSRRALVTDDGRRLYAFARGDASGTAIVLANASSDARELSLATAGITDAGSLTNAIGGGNVSVRNGRISVELAPESGAILITDRPLIPRDDPPLPALARVSDPLVPPLQVPAGTLPPEEPPTLTSSRSAFRLQWQRVPNVERTLVLRRNASADPWRVLAQLTGDSIRFVDVEVANGGTYEYALQHRVDDAWTRPSAGVTAHASPAMVAVTLTVMAPDPGGRRLFVAGDFQGWDPVRTPLVRQPDGTWRTEITAHEGDTLAYKYTLGSWDLVEKGAQLEELPDRKQIVVASADGRMSIFDRVEKWRPAGGCRQK